MASGVINTILTLTDRMSGGLGAIGKATNSLSGDLARLQKSGKFSVMGINNSLDRFATKVTTVSGILATAFVGFSVRVGEEFESAARKIDTLASGDTGGIKQELLDWSRVSGTSAATLAEAEYQALSASVPQEYSVDFVKTADKLAIGGFTTTDTAIDLMTSVMNSMNIEDEDYEKVADQLMQIQKKGKTTIGQLATSYPAAMTAAAGMGATMEDVNTQMAILTRNTGQTEESATWIKALYNELGNNGSDVAEQLKNVTGQNFSELMESGKSMGDVLEILYNSVGKNKSEFRNLFGNMRAGSGAISLLSAGWDTYAKELEEMQYISGATEEAYKKMMDTLSRKWMVFVSNVSGIGIDFYNNYLSEPLKTALDGITEKFSDPTFAAALDKLEGDLANGLASALTAAGNGIAYFVEHSDTILPALTGAAKGIAGLMVVTKTVGGINTTVKTFQTFTTVLLGTEKSSGLLKLAFAGLKTGGGLLAGGFGKLVRGGGKLLGLLTGMNPVVLIVIGVFAALVAAGVWVYKNWDKIKVTAGILGEGLKKNLQPFIDGVSRAFTTLQDAASWAWDKIKGFWDWLTNNRVVNGIMGAWSALNGGGGSADSGGYQGMGHNALGTSYFAGGLTHINEQGGEIIDLPTGTRIIPHDVSVKAAQAGSGKSVNVHVTVQGNVLGDEAYAHQLGNIIAAEIIEAV